MRRDTIPGSTTHSGPMEKPMQRTQTTARARIAWNGVAASSISGRDGSRAFHGEQACKTVCPPLKKSNSYVRNISYSVESSALGVESVGHHSHNEGDGELQLIEYFFLFFPLPLSVSSYLWLVFESKNRVLHHRRPYSFQRSPILEGGWKSII